MEVSIGRQGLELLCFAALGLALGLCYDLLRPPRYAARRPLLWDGLFCLLGAGGCFILSMGRGRLGVWEILAVLLFFCLYIQLLSPWILPWFLRVYSGILRVLTFFCQQSKKLSKIVKKFFTNASNWFIL